MLGNVIRDPFGVEGDPGETPGFGFLDVVTDLSTEKELTQVEGKWMETGDIVKGYEIHMGKTLPGAGVHPVVHIIKRNGKQVDLYDGARNETGSIWGTYVHGLFDETGFRRSLLCSLKPDDSSIIPGTKQESADSFKNRQYDLLAQHFSTHLNTSLLRKIFGINL